MLLTSEKQIIFGELLTPKEIYLKIPTGVVFSECKGVLFM